MGNSDLTSDPTETIVEWLVEIKMGQQEAFTYNNNIDTKNIVKTMCWQIDLENQVLPILVHYKSISAVFADITIRISSNPSDILSPPPNSEIL